MQCKICNEEVFINAFKLHLLNKHNTAAKDYFVKYNNAGQTHICECPGCSNETDFISLSKGFKRFCSQSCANTVSTKQRHEKEGCFNQEKARQTKLRKYGHTCNLSSQDGIQKKQQTWIRKYGTDHPMKNANIKQNMLNTHYANNNGAFFSHETITQIKNTCLEKYGVSNVFQCEDVKSKAKQTKLERYDNENYNNTEKAKRTAIEHHGGVGNASSECLQKYKETCIAKYGVDSFAKTIAFRNSMKDKALTKLKQIAPAVLDYEHGIVTCNCETCNTKFSITASLLRSRAGKHETLCTQCNPVYKFRSNGETELYDFINYNGARLNDRSVLTENRELDIFIPDKNLAIEYDGIYWHNELYKPTFYHLNKTNECEQRGIQLIHIFENEWIEKQDIVKSRINGLLGRNERIYARKTICKEISYTESKEFLEKNHIQGNCTSKYQYGLFFNDELVSVMTFGESRFKKGEFELLRFANKLNVNAIGGASKLFKHFLSDHPEINEIVSYADRRWSKGNLYEALGFKKIDTTAPNYWYVIGTSLHNRFEFQKHKLIAEGYDPNKTEHEIMLEREIYRIYDCGNLKYKYNRGL